MDTNTLIDHVKELINRCGIKECDEMGKHIESLKELTRYKDMEDKRNQSSVKSNANGNKSGVTPGNDSLVNNNSNNASGNSDKGFDFFKELVGLYKATGKRTMGMAIVFAVVCIGGAICFFCCFKSELLFITVFLISYLIFALCFLFVIKYEYSVWIKDKELSNELKKMYYQWRINKQMKDN